MKTHRQISVALLLCLASAGAPAREERVGVNDGKGDPARWSEPADTPQKKTHAAMKEAAAAQAEALAECRSLRAERKSCEAAAREQYRADALAARALLSQPVQQ